MTGKWRENEGIFLSKANLLYLHKHIIFNRADYKITRDKFVDIKGDKDEWRRPKENDNQGKDS